MESNLNEENRPQSSEESSMSDDETFKTPQFIDHSKEDKEGHLSEKPSLYIPDPLTSDSPPLGLFFLEVIKNGAVIQRKEIDKPRLTFGRSRDADCPLDHPSLSRYHACLLWNPKDGPDGSFFLLDLNSVHGTMVNKAKIPGGAPIKITPGNGIIKFGGSSRLFFLRSTNEEEDDDDEDEEGQTAVTLKKKVAEEEEQGCTWGFKDDHEEEERMDGDHDTPLGTVLSFLQTGIGPGPTKNENAYSGNPQKTIQHWFDSEGYDFEYKVDYHNGKFKCTLELPIDGQDVSIESDPCLKKKDAMVNVCLKACQILDKSELLFPWQRQRDAKRKKNESSDSEDEVIDETEEYKTKKAKKLAAKSGTVEVDNFDSLNEKWKEISNELQKLKAKLATMSIKSHEIKKEKSLEDVDALDAFMSDIKETDQENNKSSLDAKIEKSKLRLHIIELEKEQKRVEKLIKIAKPSFTLPVLESVYKSTELSKSSDSKQSTSTSQIKTEQYEQINSKSTETSIEKEGNSDEIKVKEEVKKDSSPTKLVKNKIEISFNKKNIIKPASVFTNNDEETPKPQLRPLPQKPQEYGLIVKSSSKSRVKSDKLQTESQSNFSNEEAYVEWLPPSNQTGDGKTSLNEKYGY